jgi:hypothetical protein
VVVGNQGAGDGLASVVVVPDGGGQSEDALQDAGGDTLDGAAAVAFQVELAFEGVVDRLDPLAQRLEQPLAGPWWFALVGRPQQPHATGGKDGFGLGVAVALVDQDHQPWPAGQQARFDLEQVDEHLALVGFGVGQGVGDRQPVQGGDQVQPQPPEVAGMRRAVAVARPAGQRRAADRLAGAAALDRGGVGDPGGVTSQVGVDRQRPDEVLQLRHRLSGAEILIHHAATS